MTSILLTGASMGIGRELALGWAGRTAKKSGEDKPIRLVLAARKKRELEDVAREVEAAGATALVVAGDITDAKYREDLVALAVAEYGGIDVLVNNAGRGYRAEASKIDLDEMRSLFELNVFAPLHLVQLATPHLARTRGTIVMLSSVAGVVAAPRYGAYAASKFALEALSMAMRSELASQGIRVVVIRPGPVATPFRKNAARAPGEVGYDAPDPKAQPAEAVARMTIRAVEKSLQVVETSAFVRLASTASRLAPPALRIALRRMAEKGD